MARHRNNGVSVRRGRMSAGWYIAALEASNRVLNSENRRLVRLLQRYADAAVAVVCKTDKKHKQ